MVSNQIYGLLGNIQDCLFLYTGTKTKTPFMRVPYVMLIAYERRFTPIRS